MYEIKDTGRRAVNLQEHNVFFFSFPFDSDASEKLDRPLIFCHAMLFDKPLVLVGLDLWRAHECDGEKISALPPPHLLTISISTNL